MRVIATDHLNYAHRRNFADLPYDRYRVEKHRQFYSAANFAHVRARGRSHPRLLNTHRPFPFGDIHAWHLFNAVSVGSDPWITTFETTIPRWGTVSRRQTEFALRKIAGPACRAIIAMSDCTRMLQQTLLESEFPTYFDDIESKLHVIHPAQVATITSYDDKKLGADTIRFVLVGNQFFSKGGRESVEAVSRLFKAGHSVHLDIVSGMEPDTYASFTDQTDVVSAVAQIETHSGCVTLHGRLPNEDVLRLLRDAHVALLPTYADTYGYAVLEAQASGCPVVTTDIRALPEINTSDRGWLIEVPQDDSMNARLGQATHGNFRSNLAASLHDTLAEIVADPDQIRTKAEVAMSYVQSNHSPATRAAALEAIYDDV